MTNQPNTWFAF